MLREYYPGFLHAFSARGVTNLAIAPTPAAGATLTATRIAAALRRGGRQRNIDQVAAELHQALCRPQLRQSPLAEQAMDVQALALLAALNATCAGMSNSARRPPKRSDSTPTTR